jgi:hypothetical protein
MYKFDKYITNSIIITQYINKTYQNKREIIETQVEHTRLSFLDRQSSNQNLSSRGIIIGNHRNEQNNRMLISLHDNGEDEKHAHGFADFYLLGTYFDLKHA